MQKFNVTFFQKVLEFRLTLNRLDVPRIWEAARDRYNCKICEFVDFI
jgi:hypothetical protein